MRRREKEKAPWKTARCGERQRVLSSQRVIFRRFSINDFGRHDSTDLSQHMLKVKMTISTDRIFAFPRIINFLLIKSVGQFCYENSVCGGRWSSGSSCEESATKIESNKTLMTFSRKLNMIKNFFCCSPSGTTLVVLGPACIGEEKSF